LVQAVSGAVCALWLRVRAHAPKGTYRTGDGFGGGGVFGAGKNATACGTLDLANLAGVEYPVFSLADWDR
jgi:hypothetical protein